MYYLHDQKFVYMLPKHGLRQWVSVCLLLLSSSLLTRIMTFLCLCYVQQPKRNSGLAVLPNKCLELICKSCPKLWFPYGFRILRFGENGTLVRLSATGNAKKGRRFFEVLLMSGSESRTLLDLLPPSIPPGSLVDSHIYLVIPPPYPSSPPLLHLLLYSPSLFSSHIHYSICSLLSHNWRASPSPVTSAKDTHAWPETKQ